MPIDDLVVNLSLKCLNLKELVSQEEAGVIGLGILAKELGREVGFPGEAGRRGCLGGNEDEEGDKKPGSLQFQGQGMIIKAMATCECGGGGEAGSLGTGANWSQGWSSQQSWVTSDR